MVAAQDVTGVQVPGPNRKLPGQPEDGGRALPTAMLLVRAVPCAKELWPVAVALRESGRYRCVVVIGQEVLARGVVGAGIIERYATAGFRVMDYGGDVLTGRAGWSTGPQPGRNGQPSSVQAGKAVLVKLMTSRLGTVLGMQAVLDFRMAFRRHQDHVRTARDLLVRERPDIIVMEEYGLLCWEAILAKVAGEAGIPTLMLPSSDNGQVPEVTLQTHTWNGRAIPKETRRPLNRLVATAFPTWARTFRGRTMLKYPAAESLAAWRAGLMSDPWLPQRWVFKRAVLCERARADIAREQHFRPDQLVLTGQALMDGIFQTWQDAQRVRTEVLTGLGLDPGRRTVVFTIPQLAALRALSPSEETAFLEFVLQAISEVPDTQSVLSLYAAADVGSYQSLAARYGAIIATDLDVRQLVAVCDLFVCVRSSIIWTAIACQKPTLALDFWDVGHVNFYECPGVTLVREWQDLRPNLRRLLTDAHAYRAATEQMRSVAPIWASGFDGHATERTVSLIDELVRERV